MTGAGSDSDELIVRCISAGAYLTEGATGLAERPGGERLSNLTLGATYKAVREDGYYRVWDNDGEDFLFPEWMFVEVTGARG